MGPDAPCRFDMTDRLRAALATAAARLADVSGTPRLDAELLMAHALGVSRESLLLGHMDDAPPAAFSALLARRLACEPRSEEHTSELQSLMRISYAVFCLKKKKTKKKNKIIYDTDSNN